MTIVCDDKTSSNTTIAELGFFIFASVLFFAKGIGWYDGMPVFKLFFIVASIGWLVKVLLTRYSVNEFISSFLLLFISFISYRMSGEKGILVAAMIIVGIKGVNLKKQFRVYTWIWIASCIINIFLCYAGISPDYASPREKFGSTFLSCNLGFSNHSVLQMSYMAFAMMFVFAYYEQMNKKRYLWLFIGNIIFYMYSFATTGFICCTMGLLLSYLFGEAEQKGKGIRLIRTAAKLVLPVCIVFALVAPLVNNEKIFAIFNSILNGRLDYSRYFMTSGNFTPFGCRIYEVMSERYFFLDSSYVSSLAQFGVITFVIFFALYEWAVWKMADRNMMAELGITVAMLISGLAEPFLLNMSFKNISLFFVGEVFFAEVGTHLAHHDIALFSSLNKVLPIADIEYTGNSDDKCKDTGLRRLIRFFAGCVTALPYVLSMAFHCSNVLTKFCRVLTFRGLGRIEGLRALVTWFFVGWFAAFIIQRWPVGKKKG